MSQSRQNSPESSYGRSAGQATARGLALLFGALLVGFLLLKGVDDKPREGAAVTVTTNTAVAAPDSVPVDTIDPSAPTTVATTPPPVVGATPRAAALVKVLVLNGSGKNRAASRVAQFLTTGQYDVKKSLDASASNLGGAVYWNPGFQTEAATIATYLSIPGNFGQMPAVPPIKAGAKPEPYDVIVVVDAAMADRFAAAAGASTATTPAAAGPTATVGQ
jgi:LytR cell envelope-related transcriptional attenuator